MGSILSYGGLIVDGNTTQSYVPNTAAKYTQGWEAHTVSQGGDAAVSASAANSRLTLKQGVYRVQFTAEVETEAVGGTSGDAVGVITFQLYQGGSAVAAAKTAIDVQAVDRPQSVHIEKIIEITAAQVTAGTNYVEIYNSSGDASGNDMLLVEATFEALRIAG